MFTRLRYRTQQFFAGLSAYVDEDEQRQVRQQLSPAAAQLFFDMPRDGQRHSLNVYRALQEEGHYHSALLAAALLHDCGKAAARFNIFSRSVLVLADALFRSALAELASDDPDSGWRYTAYVHLYHPEIGAAWAAEAGCSPLCAWLIEHHQAQDASGTEQERSLLAALQAADNAN